MQKATCVIMPMASGKCHTIVCGWGDTLPRSKWRQSPSIIVGTGEERAWFRKPTKKDIVQMWVNGIRFLKENRFYN